MLKKLFVSLSFGEQYLCATFLYLGLGLMTLAMTPPAINVYAQESGCGGEVNCPEGYECISGDCVCTGPT
jgi:hypothetical protein